MATLEGDIIPSIHTEHYISTVQVKYLLSASNAFTFLAIVIH